jgi:hypothetical protein
MNIMDIKEKNIGQTDRLIRAVVGALLILWALAGGPHWAWIGILPLVTAGISFCPAYKLLGMHT